MEFKVEQRTPEWFKLREGRVTASIFNDILNGTAKGWARKIAELNGEVEGFKGNDATRWGTNHEAEAINLFSFQYQLEVMDSGFWVSDEIGDIGASPDGLINDNALIEVKCPFNPDVHLKTVSEGRVPGKYIPQIQGQLYVTGRELCYFVSYDPRQTGDLQLIRIPVARDHVYIVSLIDRIVDFLKCWKNGEDPVNYFHSEPTAEDILGSSDSLPKLF